MVTKATTIEECVHLVEEHRMLVCRLCCRGIRPGRKIEGHFREHKVKGRLLADIRDYFETMELEDPVDSRLPEDGLAPVALLPKQHGYSCRHCRFLTISRDSIQQHGRTAKHAFASPDQPNYSEVQLQTWLSNKLTRYWVVEEDNSTNEGG